MFYRFITYIIISINSYASFAQIVLLDIENRTPVSFAHVVDENGSLISTSNLDGHVKFDSVFTNNNKTYILQHVSYVNKEITCNEMNSIDTIFMFKTSYPLSEVVVSNMQKEVIVLKSYYRSYELDNGIPKYYTDGIIEYYIPLENYIFPLKKRKKVKMKLLKYRSFRNNDLIKKEKERAFMVVMNLAGIPRIESGSILKTIEKGYETEILTKNLSNINKDTATVGRIKKDTTVNTIMLSLDFIAPSKEKTNTLFNYTSKIFKNEVTEIYPNADISSLTLKDLLRWEKYRKIHFKHKADKEFINLEGINELYIFDRSYIKKSEYRKINSDSYAFPESSSYSTDYWKNINQLGIPEVNKNLAYLLGKTLLEYE